MSVLTKAVLFLLLKIGIACSSGWIVWDAIRRQKIGFMAVFLGLISAATFPVGILAYLYWRAHREFPREEEQDKHQA